MVKKDHENLMSRSGRRPDTPARARLVTEGRDPNKGESECEW